MVILDRISDTIAKKKRKWFHKEAFLPIANYLNEEAICFLQEPNRNAALKKLVAVLARSGKIKDQKLFYQAILEREKIVSTGIGMGVAIPHAKMDQFKEFFWVLGIQKKEGLEWNSLDKSPVKLIFLIGGPDNRQTEYLQILSELTSFIKDEEIRRGLLSVEKKSQVLKLLQRY